MSMTGSVVFFSAPMYHSAALCSLQSWSLSRRSWESLSAFVSAFGQAKLGPFLVDDSVRPAGFVESSFCHEHDGMCDLSKGCIALARSLYRVVFLGFCQAKAGIYLGFCFGRWPGESGTLFVPRLRQGLDVVERWLSDQHDRLCEYLNGCNI